MQRTFKEWISSTNFIASLGVVASLLVVVVAFLQVASDRDRHIETWKAVAASESTALAAHAHQTMVAADLALKSINEIVAQSKPGTTDELRKLLGTREIHEMLKIRQSGVPQVSVASIVDLNGDMVNFTRNFPPRSAQGVLINLKERDYFQAHLKDTALEVFLSAPVQNKGTGTWTFYLARKIRAPSGEMLGVVLAGIESAYFQKFFKDISDDGKAYALFNAEGTSLARWPDETNDIGGNYAKGSIFRILNSGARSEMLDSSVPSGSKSYGSENRIIAPTRVADYPLVVNVRISGEVILGAWMRAAKANVIQAVLLSLIIAAMTALVLRLLRQNVKQIDEISRTSSLLEESEARLNSFFLESPVGKAIFDNGGRLARLNPTLARLSGLPAPSELATPLENPFTGVFKLELDALVQEVLTRHATFVNQPFHIPGSPSQPAAQDWLVSLFPVVGATGKYNGVGMIILDATELTRVEHQLRVMNSELEERVGLRTKELSVANIELDAFAYSVSHDLRAPLRGIDGFANMLEQECQEQLNEQARGYLQRIRNGVQRLSGIISDLLLLSRLRNTELKMQHVDITAIAREVADGFTKTGTYLTVEWRIADGLQATADAGMMRIVLENLLGNAGKYSSKTTSPVVELFLAGSDDQHLEFAVRDNGAGFDMAYANSLFKPFKRLHGQHEFEGTGIGLSTVARVIARHGGSIAGEGKVGAGATFRFSLPNKMEKS
ncbi:MAG: ATP-binding protein [Betaproteobacteria bacterium]